MRLTVRKQAGAVAFEGEVPISLDELLTARDSAACKDHGGRLLTAHIRCWQTAHDAASYQGRDSFMYQWAMVNSAMDRLCAYLVILFLFDGGDEGRDEIVEAKQMVGAAAVELALKALGENASPTERH